MILYYNIHECSCLHNENLLKYVVNIFFEKKYFKMFKLKNSRSEATFVILKG